ncbi:hypothetical protein TUBRATIS_30880 [Tubulinosema ratisbonensis]|uniref:Uncharacterized protein n=1 Tax=Tubulinosema ratisbonensis TaxID=291195 RepID=A0A437AHF0_9MICR|nr:hypothetical protein TUBRATIS_30880 [Tubulinosema ratisbonensis]
MFFILALIKLIVSTEVFAQNNTNLEFNCEESDYGNILDSSDWVDEEFSYNDETEEITPPATSLQVKNENVLANGKGKRNFKSKRRNYEEVDSSFF